MKPWNVLFLDFDGVLNSYDWMVSKPTKEQFAKEMNISVEEYTHDRNTWALRSIDPKAVAVLNTIVHKTDARVVISSSWRSAYPLHRLEEMLRRRGFEHRLFAAIPYPEDTEPEYRGRWISTWLAMLPLGLEVRWVLLDDDSWPGHEDRLVQTDFGRGLVADHIPRVIELFLTPVSRPA